MFAGTSRKTRVCLVLLITIPANCFVVHRKNGRENAARRHNVLYKIPSFSEDNSNPSDSFRANGKLDESDYDWSHLNDSYSVALNLEKCFARKVAMNNDSFRQKIGYYGNTPLYESPESNGFESNHLSSVTNGDIKKNGAAIKLNGFDLSNTIDGNFNQNKTSCNGMSTVKTTSPESTYYKNGKADPIPSAVSMWSDMMSRTWMRDHRYFRDQVNKELYTKQDTNIENNLVIFDQRSIEILKGSVLTDLDVLEIEKFWDRILPTVSYLKAEEISKVYKALCIAYSAHNGQIRKSGEPFIVHPVEVGLLLSGLKMDGCTVCAGLLHDTVEDTDLTFEEVENLFGRTVRSIVEGETKVSKLPKELAFEDDCSKKDKSEQHKQADEQAENLRQMFVAMTDDYRIIIVKLADRLHNMRTLQHMKPEKQIKISRETLDIFAPLAHRMGIWQFKSELEDIAFMYLYPTEYKRLHLRLQQHAEKFKQTLESSKELLKQRLREDVTLQQQAASVEVTGRTKEIYSLWHKMETKNIRSLDNVLDVVALRVIITPKQPSEERSESSINKSGNAESDRGVWLCYHVLGLVQHLHGFQPVPTRVKDYISFPKPNGYQSLHTALILDGQAIEVQIRTTMMHQVAEYGMASHWAYTEGKRRSLSNGDDLYNTPWLSSIKEWQNDRISSHDFVESVRRELLGKRVFVFLRNGKILNLARGATAIDAAFQIHTEVGLKMHGVEINGRSVPFSYKLKNGDVVTILTGEGEPATEWMRHAKSRSTRSKLRAYFRSLQRESLRESGKIALKDYLDQHRAIIENNSFLSKKISIPDLDDATVETYLLSFLSNSKIQYDSVEELLIAIGKNNDRNMLRSIVSLLFGVSRRVLKNAEEKWQHSNVLNEQRINGQRDLSVSEGKPWEDGNNLNDTSSGALKMQKATLPEATAFHSFDSFFATIDSKLEYADPEHLCEECLPVYGDAIVGTRARSQLDQPSTYTSATVHRIGCPKAQKAVNHAWAERRGAISINHNIDSVRLRQARQQIKTIAKIDSSRTKRPDELLEVPVRLEWFDLDDDESNTCDFLAEIVIHALDRKQLLADCSTIVSDMAEIVKTGSVTHNEDATLVFLLKVNDLSHIQAVMDRLSEVRSVMSVERRFGSELRS